MKQKDTDKILNDDALPVVNSEQEMKKQFLIRLFNITSKHDVKFEMDKAIQRFKKIGYMTDEAKEEVRNEYRQVLRQDNDIVKIITENSGISTYGLYELIYGNSVKENEIDKIERYRRLDIECLANIFCKYDFTMADGEIIAGKRIVREIREVYIANEIVQHLIREKEHGTTKTQDELKVSDDILNELEKAKLITNEPLKWVGSIRLCAYFVDEYYKEQTKKWEKAQRLFGVRNLAQQKDGYVNNKTSGKPKGYQVIDAILQKYR